MFDGLYDDPFYILASSQSGGVLQSLSGQAAVVTLLSFPGTHVKICRMGISGSRENAGASSTALLRKDAELLCFGRCRGQNQVENPNSDSS